MSDRLSLEVLFLDLVEAAAFLRIKPATLYAWVHQKRIPHRKHGRRLVFHRLDLEQWSAKQSVLPCSSFGAILSERSEKTHRSLKTHSTVEEPSNSSFFKKGE
jgi:excisionase family DNA binding protein